MNTKFRNPVIGAVAGLLLLGGAYAFGRWDAPSRGDGATRSLLDGVKAYHQQFEALTRQLNQAQIALNAGAARERALAAKRTPTPALVPAACNAWAANLSTCDQQLGELRSQVKETGRLLGMATAGRLADSTHADSSDKALKREVGKSYFLGVKLPSRRTSFAVGGLLGSALTGGACFLLRP